MTLSRIARSRVELDTEPSTWHRTGGPLCRGRPPQPDGAGAEGRGACDCAPGDGEYRPDLDFQSVPDDTAAQPAGRYRKPRGVRHQDHDGVAAPRRLLDRPA